MNLAKLFIVLFSVAIFSSCASINQGLTPNAQTIVSDFDNSVEVIQKPVSSANSLSEAWHTLGFRWNNKNSNIVYLTAGTSGTVNITGLSFNIEGEIVGAETASTLTEYGQWSTRQFKISIDNFLKLSKAKVVKMKVNMIDKYSVSSFGQSKPNAVVSGKFKEFMRQINLVNNKKK